MRSNFPNTNRPTAKNYILLKTTLGHLLLTQKHFNKSDFSDQIYIICKTNDKISQMATMARTKTGLAYPDRFYAAASYAGFGGSPDSANKDVASKFSNEVALIFYALYQQVISPFSFLIPHFIFILFFIGSCLISNNVPSTLLQLRISHVRLIIFMFCMLLLWTFEV